MKYILLFSFCFLILSNYAWASPCMHCEQMGQISCDICLRNYEKPAEKACPTLNLVVTKVERPINEGLPFRIDIELQNLGNVVARFQDGKYCSLAWSTTRPEIVKVQEQHCKKNPVVSEEILPGKSLKKSLTLVMVKTPTIQTKWFDIVFAPEVVADCKYEILMGGVSLLN